MPHNPPMLLEDIPHAAQRIQDFTSGRSLSDYQTNELLRAGVERFYIVIGEALSRLEKVDVNLTNQIMDYRKIIGFRNVLVHGYKMIDDQIVLANHSAALAHSQAPSRESLGKFWTTVRESPLAGSSNSPGGKPVPCPSPQCR